MAVRTVWKRVAVASSAVGLLAITYGVTLSQRISALKRRSHELAVIADRFSRRYTLPLAEQKTGVEPFGRVLLIGDSTLVGVGVRDVADSLGPRTLRAVPFRSGSSVVFNRAVVGAKLADTLRSQLTGLELPPDLAIIVLSANDATAGTDPQEARRTLRRILDALLAGGKTSVVIANTPNFRATPALPWLARTIVSRRAEGLARAIEIETASRPHVFVADLFREGSLAPDQYAADLFHPNAEGYALWAKVLAGAVERAARSSNRPNQ